MYEMELKELGLTNNETKVYLILLENGILNPTQISQKTGMHRSYIYDTLDRLMERGIINTVLVNNKKHYQPLDPKTLRESFEIKLRTIDEIIPKLSGIFNQTKQETRVELHRGKNVFKTSMKDILANLKKNDLLLMIGVDENMTTSLEPILINQYFNLAKKLKIKERVIIKKGGHKLNVPTTTYRELDEKYFDNTTIFMHQNKVYLLVWGNPDFMIVIDDKAIANTYRKQFELLWSIAKF